ncbi:glutathione S-transferase family protein [Sphingomonas sp. UYEF23]|uniref:glutathione S-transferase family protein n=1 Tax=Sphingomonas sp. UYEF23 TaxID=1756408 RepID=UPI0033983648
MITLHGHPFSRAHRVMWMLKELGLPFEHVPTDFRGGATRTPQHLAINPNGRVPALVDGDLTLFESLAINLYLARRYGGPLAPADVAEEALATQWSFWVATEVEKPLLLAAANLMLFAEGGRDADQAALACRKLDRPLRVMESHLAMLPYLLGERFTVADLNVSAVMTLIPITGVPLADYPKVAAWLDRCLERPAAADWKPITFSIPRPPTEAGILAMFV